MTTATLESLDTREASVFRPTELLRRFGEAAYGTLIGFEARMTAGTLSPDTLQNLADGNKIDHVIRDRLVARHAIRGYRIR